MTPDKLTKAQELCRLLTWGIVRECVDSILKGDDWEFQCQHYGRAKPYPMGFYPNDRRLYYANGWGRSVGLLPHEQWLLTGMARAALKAKEARND